MNLKTYRAASMAEALEDVKRDLGREAVILHTRSVRIGRLLGLLGWRHVWEVTAAPNVNVVPRGGAEGQYVTETSPSPASPEESGPGEGKQTIAVASPAQAPPGESRAIDTQEEQLSQIRSMLASLVAGKATGGEPGLPLALEQFHDHLRNQDVDEPIATELITDLKLNLTGQELANRRAVAARLAELVATRIPCVPAPAEAGGTLRGRVMVLVGPTGVGKTTTIAKLAANMKLKEGKKVGLVTIDTYRIAAVDQLRTYAEIIDVPLRTVLTPQEMSQAMYAMRGLDAILIDTVGRSQNDQLRLNQLRGFLEAAEADEVHLVVAATANRRCAANVVRQFRPLGVTHLIVTKLDEAEGCGIVLNAARDGKAPLSFISTGQEVPDDIVAADPHELACRIVGDPDHAA